MKERDGRGGKRHIKVTEEHINYMVETIENDPLLTLKELTDQILSKFQLSLSKTTVSRHLDLQLYTLKGIRRVSETANSPTNKKKKGICVKHSETYLGTKKDILYRRNKL